MAMKTFQVTLTVTHVDVDFASDVKDWDWQALVGDTDCAVTCTNVQKLRSTPKDHIHHIYA
jgi:hypothetical protein